MLHHAEINFIADGRAFPYRKKHPEFNGDRMKKWLKEDNEVIIMSNENKKLWISMIVLGIFFIFIILFPYPESWSVISRFVITLIPFLIIQYFLSRFLNKKFPTYSDGRDDLKNR